VLIPGYLRLVAYLPGRQVVTDNGQLKFYRLRFHHAMLVQKFSLQRAHSSAAGSVNLSFGL